MKKLIADLQAFTTSVHKFTEVLEDKYESPVLADKLAYFHECLVGFCKYSPSFTNETEKDSHSFAVAKLEELQAKLETVNVGSNVFDIIDALRLLCSRTLTIIELLEDEE